MLLPLMIAACSLLQTDAKPDPAITRADLERCVKFLASDELAGRPAGSAEAMRAAEYLAAALARAGVQPGGDDGTYLQKVPLKRTTFNSVPKLTMWDEAGATSELIYGVDFDWHGGVPAKKRLRVRAVTKDDEMIAFTDDEVVLFLDGKDSDQRRWLGEKRGAGFGLILTPGSDKPGLRARDQAPRGQQFVAADDAISPLKLAARGTFLEALRAGKVKAVRVECDFKLESLPAANVIGLVRGVGTKENPKLAEELVAFSAHYDHVGRIERKTDAAPDEDVDLIKNGADDDASGCAAVLELAEAFGAGPKPARSLMFFFATGEEIGLVGTYWYLDRPIWPIERTVCDLNFEMIGRADPLVGGAGKLWLTGDERSNLGDEFRARGMAVVADPRPTQRFFSRSDNYALALRGVVAQTLSSYNLHADYHGVDDETERIDFEHMESALRGAWAGVQALADGSLAPAWKPGGDPSKK